MQTKDAIRLTHAAFDGNYCGGEWGPIVSGIAEASGYLGHVLACVSELRAAGTTYNSEVGPRAAAMMAERYGYEEVALDPKIDFGTSRDFGSHCYMAGCAYRERLTRETNKAEANKLTVGTVYKKLRMADGRTFTSVRLLSFSHTGMGCKLQGKHGAAAVEVNCSAVGLRQMVERAEQRAATLQSRRRSNT